MPFLASRSLKIVKYFRNHFQYFKDNQRGSAIIEFGFIAPLVILIIVGAMEVAMIMFVTGLVEGGVREVARFAITGNEIAGKSREEVIVSHLNDITMNLLDIQDENVDILVYPSFEDIGEPEPFIDNSPNNGQYDQGESFTDINGNGNWDPDMGAAGAGGPEDIVLYRVNYNWPMLTGMLAETFGESLDLQATIAVRNEPYDPS